MRELLGRVGSALAYVSQMSWLVVVSLLAAGWDDWAAVVVVEAFALLAVSGAILIGLLVDLAFFKSRVR